MFKCFALIVKIFTRYRVGFRNIWLRLQFIVVAKLFRHGRVNLLDSVQYEPQLRERLPYRDHKANASTIVCLLAVVPR